MKKLLFIMLTAVMALSLSSCDPKGNKETNDQPQLVYNLKATADGQVEFTQFNGGAKVNGNAELYQCNDNVDSLSLDSLKAPLLSNALNSNDAEVAKLASQVNEVLTVKGIEGNYHLKLIGYVKYGPVIIRIDEEYPKSE